MHTLNEAQRNAVRCDSGAALVLAGAGTGKTRVIVERLVWLVEERGVDARHLLALTFTNRAAGEMKRRVAERLGVERLPAWVGTFHSFGLFLLRREMEALGRSKTFTIYDDADQMSLMKRLLKDLPSSLEHVSPRGGVAVDQPVQAGRFRARLGDGTGAGRGGDVPAFVEGVPQEPGEGLGGGFRRSAGAYGAGVGGASGGPGEVPARYRHVLVDEYQDTNRAQYLIARALSGPDGNLFVVGDEDQGIYSWRGADIRNILEFEKDFSDARVFRLEENYRSTAPILEVANAVVANNEYRLGKTLWTGEQGGAPVRLPIGFGRG